VVDRVEAQLARAAARQDDLVVLLRVPAEEHEEHFAARCFDYRPGSGPDYEHELFRFGDRPGDVDCSDLSAISR